MSKGMIGVFHSENNGMQLSSISLRASASSRELEKAVLNEHRDVNLTLVKSYHIECDSEIAEVEKYLRKLFTQIFGEYTPPFNGWEYYRASCEKVISLIDIILPLCEIVTDYSDQGV